MTEKEELFDFQVTFESNKYHDLKVKVKNSVTGIVKDVISFVEQISSEHYSCIKITKDLATLQQNIASLSLKHDDLQKQVEKKGKAKYSSEMNKSLKLMLYNLFKQNLGFEIKPIKSGWKENPYEVLFSFKNIRKDNPDKPYKFVLVVREDLYKVSDCVPSIKELDEMLKELNKTDDLRSFVIKVRRKFCVLSGSREPMNDCTNNP